MNQFADSKELGDKDVAIFWDYENVPLPPWCNPADAAKRIHGAVSKYGRITDRRIYFDSAKASQGGRGWSELDLSGFDLVNTPTRNSKETLDKKMIVDILAFAWDCTATSRKPCVVLLTSDGDYAYTLAKLRDRGVMNIVMFGKDSSVAQILVDNAEVALSFERDVLSTQVTLGKEREKKSQLITTGPSDNIFLKNLLVPSEVKDLVQFLEQYAPVDYALVKQLAASDGCCAKVGFMITGHGKMFIEKSNSSSLVYQGRQLTASYDNSPLTLAEMATFGSSQIYINPSSVLTSALQSLPSDADRSLNITFCTALCIAQKYFSRAQSTSYKQCWVPHSQCGQSFSSINKYQHLTKEERKDILKRARDQSIFQGYVQVTRRKLSDNQEYVYISTSWWLSNQGSRDDLTREFFLRLTPTGRSLLSQEPIPKMRQTRDKGTARSKQLTSYHNNATSWVYLKKLPSSIQIMDLVRFLDEEIKAPVNCVIFEDQPYVKWCSAHVQFSSIKDASRVKASSKKNEGSGLIYCGRAIQAIVDTMIPSGASIAEDNTNRSYKKAVNVDLSLSIDNTNSMIGTYNASPDIIALCYIVYNSQKSGEDEGSLPTRNIWAKYSVVFSHFQESELSHYHENAISKDKCISLYEAVRDQAINEGYISTGRCALNSGNKEIVRVPWFDNQGLQDDLSTEIYLCLSKKGWQLQLSSLQSTANSTTQIEMKSELELNGGNISILPPKKFKSNSMPAEITETKDARKDHDSEDGEESITKYNADFTTAAITLELKKLAESTRSWFVKS